MSTDTSPLTSDLARKIINIRGDLANRLVRGVFWIGVLIVPLSVARYQTTGWLAVYTLHLAFAALYLFLFLARKHLPTWLKSGAVVAILFTVGVAGVLSLGLAAPALWWLMGSVVIANVLFSKRWSRATMLAAVLAIVGVGIGYTTGMLELSVNLNTYMREPIAWATLLLGAGGFVVVVAQALSVYDKSVALAVEHSMIQWVDGLPLGVLVLDADGHVHYGNRRLEELLGVNLLDLKQASNASGPIQVFEAIGGNVAGTGKRFPAGLHPLFRALQGEESNIEDLEIMIRGEPRQFSVTGRSVRDAEGNVTYGVGTFEDITQRKRGEFELQRAKDRAESASRAKSQLLSNMNHEMRVPIDTVLGMVQLLRRTPLSARQQEYVGRTEAVSRALLATVNDMLDYLETATGKLVLTPRLFHIDLILAELQQRLQTQIGDKPIELSVVCDPDIPNVLWGDGDRLLQVLSNLGENAVKFTPAGPVTVVVHLKERDVDSVLLDFTVCDKGIGIAPRDKHRIFSGFFQAEGLQKQGLGGAGVGLAVADRLVRLMGSSISVGSTVGEGSTFTFQLRIMLTPEEVEDQLYPVM